MSVRIWIGSYHILISIIIKHVQSSFSLELYEIALYLYTYREHNLSSVAGRLSTLPTISSYLTHHIEIIRSLPYRKPARFRIQKQ